MLEPGPAAFGRRFRYCMPQMAFLNALYHEQARDWARARRWHRLSQRATERLCATSAVHGLEAASFYWTSESRRLLALLEQADAVGLSDGLTTLMADHETPSAALGGSSPSVEDIGRLLEALADADPSAAYGQFLADTASRLEIQGASAPHGSAVRAVARFLELSSARLCGRPTREPDAAFERAISELVARDGRLRDRLKQLLERERRRMRPSFASLAQQGWSTPRWR